MTRMRSFVTVLVCLCVSSLTLLAQDKTSTGAAQHVGTWKLVSTKYGSATEHSPFSGTRIKIINPTHFTWLQVQSGKVAVTAGGKYTLTNGAYTESIDFAG